MARDSASTRGEHLRHALEHSPALTLLKAYDGDWIIPLFADLEAEGGVINFEAFHARVEDAAEVAKPGRAESVSPSERCRKWVDAGWLDMPTLNGTFHYRLTSDTRRVLEFIRSLTGTASSVSGARFGSIANAIRELAVMTDPDRHAQAQRLDREIADLQRRRDAIVSGRARLASAQEARSQLQEVVSMLAPMASDFAKLENRVESTHHETARRAFSDAPSKAELVDEYLDANDLLTATDEGRNYQALVRMLASDEAAQVREDIDQILGLDFAHAHMTGPERDLLDGMLSSLLGQQLKVQGTHTRWAASLRRFLTRQPAARRQQLVDAVDRALAAGSEWAGADPGLRHIVPITIGVGALDLPESSGLKLWSEPVREEVEVVATEATEDLPDDQRAALRLAAGTSTKAVVDTINSLIVQGQLVTAGDIVAATPEEFRHMGLVTSIFAVALDEQALDESDSDEFTIKEKTYVLPGKVTFHKQLTQSSRRTS